MDKITPELLLRGYGVGIFPMSEHRDDPEIFWVDPERRGVFPLKTFHLSRSTARMMRRCGWVARINSDFDAVVDACANRTDTWINDEIRSLYTGLYALGQAHSFEVWDGDTLAGGVYGVTLGTAFFGESMFSARTNGSKIALTCLVDHLRRAGFTLFDTQFLTDHLASLGAIEISRSAYHKLLDQAQMANARFDGPTAPLYDVVQRMTQTS